MGFKQVKTSGTSSGRGRGGGGPHGRLVPEPFGRIAKNGSLALNTSGSNLLLDNGFLDFADIFYDEKRMAIGFKNPSSGLSSRDSRKITKGPGKGKLRQISVGSLLKEHGLNDLRGKSTRFRASYDKRSKMMIIDLAKVVA